MAPFIFLCPNTGFRVRGWLEAEPADEGAETYESVECAACGRLHFVNRKNGQVLGAESR